MDLKDCKKGMKVLSADGKFHKIKQKTTRKVKSIYEVKTPKNLSVKVT